MAEVNKDLDFGTLAIAHKIINHEQLEEAQELLEKEKEQNAETSRTLEDILKELNYVKEEEVWAIYKAQERLLRDATSIGEKIGGYEIISKIGEGGLGVVYKARQLSMGRVVALKVLHEKWLSDDEFRKRFLVEARLVGRLSHPNLIQVIDVGRHRNQLYYSMEFIDGDPVEKMLDEQKKLPILESINIITQVAGALDYLADKKIVHRDVKPGNIMLTRKGIAKLGDFGFVKSSLDSILSPNGEILGTPDYISPEAASGDRTIDYRSDIYCLGVTMYHMICGTPPFYGTSEDVLDSHIFHKPPSIKEYCPEAPNKLCSIIYKMMEKDPDKRQQSFAEIITELEAVRLTISPNSQPAPTTSFTPISPTNSILAKKVKYLTAGLIGAGVLLAVAAGYIIYLLHSIPQ